ncbi:MAG: Long-chain-fatty-acid CoA ligase (AMP-forming) [Acidobacteria bacterium]|nr:Long-chain-fatty-acid CoA ligase (AMP-forming) [Acidobacteriota bacterium]
MKYRNIYSLFRERVAQYRDRDVFFVREDDHWKGISWDVFDREARAFASALIVSGLQKGGSVAILMGNVPAWPISDLGTILAGGVSVGLYPTSSAEQCQYVINHSDAEFVLVDSPLQLDKVLSVQASLVTVKSIIALDESLARDNPGVMSYQQFLQVGAEHLSATSEVVEMRAGNAQPDDTVIMVYTSGTTGLPKGACLSHRYVINSVESLHQVIPFSDSDVAFSYLPYCHVAERISGLYNRLYAGASAYFVNDPTKLWDYMMELGPRMFPSLPRFFEKVHARIVADLEQDTPEEQRRFADVLTLGRQISRLRQNRADIPQGLTQEYDRVAGPVLERVRRYFGGRIEFATSGGAPLPTEIAEFFDALSIPLLQAYGLTENVCVAFNRPDDYRFGTVGPPMPGCSVRIADDGEILVQSEMMFSGYYKEPDKTAEVFRDGWLLTGDLGELDADGFLRITGRKKEIIVTSTGKNISPALIENLLKEHHLISHALVYGDGKSYLVSLLTLNQLETESFARSHGIGYADFAELTRNKNVIELVGRIVAGVNNRVSSTEAIRKFAVLDHDLTIEADEITPTSKIKRTIVSERYRDILERLYA